MGGAQAEYTTPRPTAFVARLVENGANLDVSPRPDGCVAGASCEIGRVVPLITVHAFCTDPAAPHDKVTQTQSGWGIIVEKYRPVGCAQENQVRFPANQGHLYEVAETPEAAHAAARKGMEACAKSEVRPVFFETYQDFWG